MNSATEPRIVEFGPDRLIGVSRVCRTSADCHDAWEGEGGFMARADEIQAREAQTPYYAVCRCVKGAEPGAFEYVAAVPVAASAQTPAGMVEVVILAGQYAVFSVAGLSDIGKVWGYTGEWLKAHPEWQGFCDGSPDSCGCVDHPSFELYSPGYDGGELFIYVPIRPASV